MFQTIDIERARDRLSVKGLAQKSGIKYDTLLSKLNGRSEFTRVEMLKLQSSFSAHVPLDDLFATKQDAGQK